MRTLPTLPDGAIESRLYRAVTLSCAREGMSVRAFGRAALGDPGFAAALVRGRSPRLATADRALAFMGAAPTGPFFRAEVEAFLDATGMKRSLFGRAAAGNPSFIVQLRHGLSPTLATVRRVRAWMTSQANAAELREIRRRTGPAPSFLSVLPTTGGDLRPERSARLEAQAPRREKPTVPPAANGGSGQIAGGAAPARSKTAPRRGNSTPPVPAPAKRGGTRAAAKPRPAPAEKTASKLARADSNAGNRAPDRRKVEPDQNFY